MKFFDVVLVSLMVVFIIIGVHQSFIFGFANSYWIFMLTFVLLFWFKIRKSMINGEKLKHKEVNHKKIYRKKVKSK